MRRIGTGRRSRIWLEVEELEAATDGALRAAGLYPGYDAGAVDIEALLEVHLGAAVDYAVDLPDTILGFTIFETPPRVAVSRRLTELALAPGASHGLLGRWRATLAHEAAHIILHAGLADEGVMTPQLTSENLSAPEETTANWLEVQANMGMAALLMPRGPFLFQARRALEAQPALLPVARDSLQAERLVSILAHQFSTSREATGWRLRNLGWTVDKPA
ncbi:MAG TPA: ImmA/IrrE family metallo-endopeptidase [Candidatus Limnocylindrales bacterium]|nr:ImmA/IrrE family metallo-endopeptidase [Candidatus Limnocylindrales bacterium]